MRELFVFQLLQREARGKRAFFALAQDLRVDAPDEARMTTHPLVVAEPDMVDDQDEGSKLVRERRGIGDELDHSRAVFVAGAQRLSQRVDDDQAGRDASGLDCSRERREVTLFRSKVRRSGYEVEGNASGKIGARSFKADLSLSQSGRALRRDIDRRRLRHAPPRPFPAERDMQGKIGDDEGFKRLRCAIERANALTRNEALYKPFLARL